MEILNKYIYDPQLDLLGKGGFATVYKAYDKVLEMPVALKFFHPQEQANKYTIINEIKRAILLAHPNIVKYYGVETMSNRNFHGQDEEVQIGVMEFVQEGQLKTYMSQHPLSMDELKKLLLDILEGLKYLHSEGIIHRDIKPQNILLGRDKQNRLVAKIADFGISKSADSNQASASILLGTIEYMAPEQFNPERYGINKKISYNVDTWAFGVTAYYLLTGNLLFGSRSGDTSAAQMISKIVNAEGMDQKINKLTEPFRSVLKKCIIPDANKRTNDIDELIAALKEQPYLPGKTVSLKPDTSAQLSHFKDTEPIVTENDQTLEIPKTTEPAPVTPKRKKAVPKPIKQELTIDDDSTKAIENPVEPLVPLELESEPKKKTGKMIWLLVLLAIIGAGSFLAYQKIYKDAVQEPVATAADGVLDNYVSTLKELPGGSFIMGSNDPKRSLDAPEHNVSVNTFLINSYEVTQKEWNTIMNDFKYKDSSMGNFPADSISWDDAKAYINTLNKMLEQAKTKGKTFPFKQFRLPSNSEWEYACLYNRIAGETVDLDKISWNADNAAKQSHPVGTRQPDKNGLSDMLGNVYEWCEDWYGPYLQPSPKQGKVLRGGDYNDIFFVNPKARNAEVVNKRNKNIGFRLAADKSENK